MVLAKVHRDNATRTGRRGNDPGVSGAHIAEVIVAETEGDMARFAKQHVGLGQADTGRQRVRPALRSRILTRFTDLGERAQIVCPRFGFAGRRGLRW